jgi:hypothetical protein
MEFEPWDGWRRDVIAGGVGAAIAAAILGVTGLLYAQGVEDELTATRAREYQARKEAERANSDAEAQAAQVARHFETAGRLRQQMVGGVVDTP